MTETADPMGAVTTLLVGATGAWVLDTAATTIEFHTKALWGMVKVVGRITAASGSGMVAADGAVTGTVAFESASINTGNAKRDEHLRTRDFLDVGKFPTFSYTVTGAEPAAGGRLTVTGTLTIRGQSRPVELLATVAEVAPGHVTLSAETDIDRSLWGISWSKMGAGQMNHVVVTAHFSRP